MITNISRKQLIGLSVIICHLSFSVALISCDDYLDTTNESVPPAHEELTSLDALKATTANLYASPWLYFHKQRFIQLGDARANNIYTSGTAISDMNTQASMSEFKENTSVLYAWASLYNVITQAGYIVNDYAPYCVAQAICSQEEANVCLAEARFMRAMAYWFLAIYWHDVPIVDDAVTISPSANANKFEDVIQYAICEAEFARKWLPVTPYAKGRVSRVSAETLLSRLYITAGAFAKGGHFSADFKSRVLDSYYEGDDDYSSSLSLREFYYAKAAEAARAAINNAAEGGYKLMDDYEELFRVQNNNCEEVLFAFQVVQGNSAYGLGNELQGAFCYDPCLDHNYGRAWSTWASYDFVYVASKRGGLKRTRGNIMPDGMTYSYMFHEEDTCKVKATPWTVVRKNATMPIKKQVVGGPIATNNISFNGNSGFCTPMLRLSEAYLNLTEALMGLYDTEETQNSKLLEGVNTVRRRAYSYEIANGGYPGDYGTTGTFNLDSLLQERRMEFFVEGLYWSDIVRRSLMGETHLNRMVNYMNNRLFEVEGDSIMGSHRLYDYKYTAASTTDRIGTVKLTLATDGGYKISRPCHDCVHHIAEGSYCHSQSVGNEDNLWSMVYPPTETTLNPNLLLAPVGYDFTTIIANKKDYRYE